MNIHIVSSSFQTEQKHVMWALFRHNPPNYIFFIDRKNFLAEILFKEKQHINFLIRFRNGHGSAYSRNINQVIEEGKLSNFPTVVQRCFLWKTSEIAGERRSAISLTNQVNFGTPTF